MTKFVKKSEINCKWYEIDAKNAVVGRLATIITKIIRGKNKNDVARSIENLNRKIISLPIGIEKLGPSPCYREKLKDNYRMQIVLKSDKKYDSTGSIVHNIYKNAIKNSNLRKNTYGPKLIVDVNPISLL